MTTRTPPPATLAGLLLLAILATPPAAACAAIPLSSATDRGFAQTVAQGGLFEVKAGQAAARQGSTADVRDLGVAEAHDHTEVGAKLAAAAAQAGFTVPDALNEPFRRQLDRLQNLSGTRFDAEFLAEMKTIHAKDGAAFAQEAQAGTDPGLRAFAAETLRIVRRHIGALNALPAAGT